MSQVALFGPDRGWSLEPVATWLYTEGRRLRDAAALIEGLGAQPVAAGAHSDRLALMSRTLHPQLVRGGEILQFIGDAILIVFEIGGGGSCKHMRGGA